MTAIGFPVSEAIRTAPPSTAPLRAPSPAGVLLGSERVVSGARHQVVRADPARATRCAPATHRSARHDPGWEPSAHTPVSTCRVRQDHRAQRLAHPPRVTVDGYPCRVAVPRRGRQRPDTPPCPHDSRPPPGWHRRQPGSGARHLDLNRSDRDRQRGSSRRRRLADNAVDPRVRRLPRHQRTGRARGDGVPTRPPAKSAAPGDGDPFGPADAPCSAPQSGTAHRGPCGRSALHAT